MRGSLKGIVSRVDRLAARLRPSPADFSTMSDEAFCAWISERIKKVGGPEAFCAHCGLEPQQARAMLMYVRDHGDRTAEQYLGDPHVPCVTTRTVSGER